MKTPDLNLFVQETKFFDNECNKGGGGAIDLVAHVRNCSPRDAIIWLSESFGKAGEVQPHLLGNSDLPKKPEHVPFSQQLLIHATNSRQLWPEARGYLTNKRQIPADLVDQLHDAGRIYANDKAGVVFIHTTAQGVPAGCSIRSSHHQSGFRQCLGNKTEAWFYVGDLSNARRAFVTESPIDALSLATLKKPRQSVIFSIAGNYVPEPLARLAVSHGWDLVLALDNDEAGRKGFDHCHGLIANLFPAAPLPTKLVPHNKDWNEDLCRSTRALP